MSWNNITPWRVIHALNEQWFALVTCALPDEYKLWMFRDDRYD